MKYFNLSDDEADTEMKHIGIRYQQYLQAKKSDLAKEKIIIPNFGAMIASNILNKSDGILNCDLFIQMEIMIHLSELIKKLLKYLNRVQVY